MDKLIIDNSETNYLIDREGRIYSTTTKKFKKISEKGVVQLSINGKSHSFTVSYLIALTYIENPNNYKKTIHIDGNYMNNCVDNIRWISDKENGERTAKKRKENSSYRIVGVEAQNIVEKHYTAPEDLVEDNSEYYCHASNGLLVCSNGQIYSQEKEIATYMREDGYYGFSFQNKNFLLHVFIWESFNKRKKGKGMDINHINGDKSDNRLCNLEEISHRQNMRHAAEKLGRCGAKPVGEFDDEGNLLRRFGSAGEAARAIGILPGSMRNTIRRNGKCYNGLSYVYLV